MGTLRQSIIFVLKEQTVTAKEISQAVGIREKEVYEHLAHIAQSRSLGGKFTLIPSTCKDCGFSFEKGTGSRRREDVSCAEVRPSLHPGS